MKIIDRSTYALVVILAAGAYALNYFTVYHLTMTRTMIYLNDRLSDHIDPYFPMQWIFRTAAVLAAVILFMAIRKKIDIGKRELVTYCVIIALYFNVALEFAALEFDAVFFMSYMLGTSALIESVRVIILSHRGLQAKKK